MRQIWLLPFYRKKNKDNKNGDAPDPSFLVSDGARSLQYKLTFQAGQGTTAPTILMPAILHSSYLTLKLLCIQICQVSLPQINFV